MLGYTIAGRYLFVVYALKSKGIARVITAMDMDDKTRKLYRKKNKRRLMKVPDFKTAGDESQFWEEHSVADYWEDLDESDDIFERPALTAVTIKFDPLVLKKIKMLAKKRGLSYNAYTRYLLAKSVELELIQKPSA
jgi:predicted DNA binding CopG/RHH family protein